MPALRPGTPQPVVANARRRGDDDRALRLDPRRLRPQLGRAGFVHRSRDDVPTASREPLIRFRGVRFGGVRFGGVRFGAIAAGQRRRWSNPPSAFGALRRGLEREVRRRAREPTRTVVRDRSRVARGTKAAGGASRSTHPAVASEAACCSGRPTAGRARGADRQSGEVPRTQHTQHTQRNRRDRNNQRNRRIGRPARRRRMEAQEANKCVGRTGVAACWLAVVTPQPGSASLCRRFKLTPSPPIRGRSSFVPMRACSTCDLPVLRPRSSRLPFARRRLPPKRPRRHQRLRRLRATAAPAAASCCSRPASAASTAQRAAA